MSRNGFLDYSRLIAAAGIVWFHSEATGYRVAYAALPFFLVLLALPTRSGLRDRTRRLLIPFLVWSAIYALLRIAIAVRHGQDIFIWWQPWMALTGTAVHLWFLPFAFLVALAAPVLGSTKATVLLPVLAAAVLAFMGETGAFPWYQWSFGIVPVLIGFVYVRSARTGALVLVASYLVLEVFRPSPDNAVILAGTALAMIAMSISLPATWLSAWCARISMGVYLSQMLVLYVLEVSGLQGVPLAVLAICGSVLVAIAIEVALQRVKPGPV